jgi:hypothetical protein
MLVLRTPLNVLTQHWVDPHERGWIAPEQLAVPAGRATILDMKNKLSAKLERARLSSRSSLLPSAIGGWARARENLDRAESPLVAIQSGGLGLPVPPGLSG